MDKEKLERGRELDRRLKKAEDNLGMLKRINIKEMTITGLSEEIYFPDGFPKIEFVANLLSYAEKEIKKLKEEFEAL